MSFRSKNTDTNQVTHTFTSAGVTDWIRVSPFFGRNAAISGRWGATSTNGCSVKVECAISTDSTATTNLARVRSSQKSLPIRSTSGVATGIFSAIRFRTTAGVFSTAKFARVTFASVLASS